MSGAEDIFPAWDASLEPEAETLTVGQVAVRIQALLARGFPEPFWLVGETSGLERMRGGRAGHWYFKLVDEEGERDRRASLNVKMWRSTVARLFGAQGRLRGRLDPADGIVLRVLVKPDFWPPGGQISFTISDVDPEHTLGSLDRQRREVLERLMSEGADGWNKSRPLAPVPLRIGLVTSLESAAHHDVLQTLRGSGLGFSVLCCDARTQGAETSSSVCAALATLARRPLDVLLLVRGGGSRLDLSWFDREDVARAVAGCPLPVLTGIGHEIDSSVTDVMAHTSFKTPTAAAEFLVHRARDARAAIDLAQQRIESIAAASLEDAQRHVTDGARRLLPLVREALGRAEQGLEERVARLERAGRRQLEHAEQGLERARSRLVVGRPAERLAELGGRLEADARRVAERALTQLSRSEERLAAAAGRVRLLDPRNVLQRGFAWLRDVDGRVIKEASQAQVGEALVAVLRDGELDLVTRAVRPDPAPPV